MRQQLATVGTHGCDSMCVDAVVGCRACFPNFKNSEKVLLFCICHRGLKHAVAETTTSSSRSCTRTSPHPAVVHELDDCMHHINAVLNDVMNPPTQRFAFVFCFASSGVYFLFI